MNFKNYANYYNLLYKDKDYNKEAKYINTLLKNNTINTGDILELGCGTGIHADLLSKNGYNVHGIDNSEDMLRKAKELAKVNPNIFFNKGDVRNYRVDRKFDAVLSLFHVVSYQTTNMDLKKIFETVNFHLKSGGIFIFDFWYGPAVLTIKPDIRIKRMEDNLYKLTRISEPQIYYNKNLVDVNFDIFIENKQTNEITEIKEIHKMRYLFDSEIELLLDDFGFKIVNSEEWLTGKSPSWDTWGVCFVCKK